jgi:hypothetical protein
MFRTRRGRDDLKQPLPDALARLSLSQACALGLGPCLGCAIAPFETLGEAVSLLGLDGARVLAGVRGTRRRRPR